MNELAEQVTVFDPGEHLFAPPPRPHTDAVVDTLVSALRLSLETSTRTAPSADPRTRTPDLAHRLRLGRLAGRATYFRPAPRNRYKAPDRNLCLSQRQRGQFSNRRSSI
jgi:hypothetical protein